MQIHRHPLLTVVERYRQLGLNPKAGNRCKQSLLTSNYIQEVSVPTRKARIKLLTLTDKGRELLTTWGYEPSQNHRRGSVEHP